MKDLKFSKIIVPIALILSLGGSLVACQKVDLGTFQDPTLIGSACNTSAECNSIANSSCIEMKCSCNPEFFESESLEQCLSKPTLIGNDCHTTLAPCPNTIVESFCNNATDIGSADYGVCACKITHFENSDNTQCIINPSLIGNQCDDVKAPCPISNSFCFDNAFKLDKVGILVYGVCVCDSGFFNTTSRTTCSPIPTKLEDLCTTQIPGQCPISNSQCVNETTVGDEYNGKCKCNEYYFGTSDNGMCHPWPTAVGSGQCQDNSHCGRIEFSNCNILGAFGTCECNANYAANAAGNQCVPTMLELPCSINSQCQINLGNDSACIPSGSQLVCGCVNNTYVSTDRLECLSQVQNVGDNCTEPQQCYSLGDSSSVSCDSSCKCNTGYVANTGNTECLIVRSHGQGCLDSHQCSATNDYFTCAMGLSRTCECISGRTWIDYRQQCVKNVTQYEGECELPEECRAGLGNNADCFFPSENMGNGRCLCKDEFTFVESLRSCIKGVPWNAICETDGECMAGINNFAECSPNKRCGCKSSAISQNNSCYEKKLVGDSCTLDNECTVPITGEVLCDPASKRCSCKVGYVPELSNAVCTSGAFSIHGFEWAALLLSCLLSFVYSYY